MEVYVATHKENKLISNNYLIPLHVGAAGKEGIAGYIRDDSGDNISSKNYAYSELTGLYWVWKNTTSEIIGLCHYRRYLCSQHIDKDAPYGMYEMDFATLELAMRPDPDGILFDLEKNDIVIPKQLNMHTYLDRHYLDDMKKPLNSPVFVLLNAIYNVRKDEFFAIRQFLSTSSFLHPCNIIIAKRHILNMYCEWLFPILFEFERLMAGYPPEEMTRSCGYMGEMLYTWWAHSRDLRKVYRPILWASDAS